MTTRTRTTGFVDFAEGHDVLKRDGLPATCYFLLSTKPCSGPGAHKTTDTLAGGVGEIAGTGYARQAQPAPAAAMWFKSTATWRIVFEELLWETVLSHDWSSPMQSIILATTADNTGSAIGAWASSEPIDVDLPWVTYKFKPTLVVTREN